MVSAPRAPEGAPVARGAAKEADKSNELAALAIRSGAAGKLASLLRRGSIGPWPSA